MLSAFPPKPNKKSPAKKIKKKGENKEEVCHHGGAVGLEEVELCGRSAMEKVTILRRGESLDSKVKSESRKEAFCFFFPFFLLFLLRLLCLLLMMPISIYSSAQGTDPTMPTSEAMASLAVAV